jgi:hypothetical protein
LNAILIQFHSLPFSQNISPISILLINSKAAEPEYSTPLIARAANRHDPEPVLSTYILRAYFLKIRPNNYLTLATEPEGSTPPILKPATTDGPEPVPSTSINYFTRIHKNVKLRHITKRSTKFSVIIAKPKFGFLVARIRTGLRIFI